MAIDGNCGTNVSSYTRKRHVVGLFLPCSLTTGNGGLPFNSDSGPYVVFLRDDGIRVSNGS